MSYALRRPVAVFLVVLFAGLPGLANAQTPEVTLRGFVVDAETGEPLPGANVVVSGLRPHRPPQGAAAGTNGYYLVEGLAAGRYVVRTSFVGYQTRRDTIDLSEEETRVTRTMELRATEQRLENVVVTERKEGATSQEAGRQTVAPDNLTRVPTPSVSGDLVGYLQSMPGMVSVGDQGGKLYVRGGTPDQNLILMDKMQVYRPFHIVGFHSVFPEDLISDATVYAGGFPAEYSGRLSSVIDVQMRGGSRDRTRAAVTAGPLLTGVRAEGPLNDHGLSLLASARFSQIERTAPTLLGEKRPLRFNDQFLKLQNTFESGRCGFTGLHTYDRGLIDAESDDVFRWSNYAMGGRCVGVSPASSALVDLSISTSYVQNAVGQGSNPERQADLLDVATKVDVTRPLDGPAEIRGGFRFHLSELSYGLGEKFQGYRLGSADWLAVRGFTQGTVPVGSRFEVEPGLVVSVPFDYPPTLEPRVRASWQPFGSRAHEASVALGYYRQTVVGLSDERDIGSVFTAWLPAPAGGKRPSALHAILGWRQEVGTLQFTAEGYYKDLGNLSVPEWSPIARFTTDLARADGTTYGVDLRMEVERGSLYGYLGYGFSWTRYTATQENFGVWFDTEVQSYHPAHDRRHEVNAVVSADLGLLMTDLRWQFGTGRPYTKPFGFDSFLRFRELRESPRTYGTPRLLYEKPYRARLPHYHRLDVSLRRTFELGATTLTTKAGAINLYDRQNLFYFDLFTQRRINQLPVVPYLAIEVEI